MWKVKCENETRFSSVQSLFDIMINNEVIIKISVVDKCGSCYVHLSIEHMQ